jgi:hypothetical protein
MPEQLPGIEEMLFPDKKPSPDHPILTIFIFLGAVAILVMIGFIGYACAINNDTHVVDIKQYGFDTPQVLVEDNIGQRAWFECRTQVRMRAALAAKEK